MALWVSALANELDEKQEAILIPRLTEIDKRNNIQDVKIAVVETSVKSMHDDIKGNKEMLIEILKRLP